MRLLNGLNIGDVDCLSTLLCHMEPAPFITKTVSWSNAADAKWCFLVRWIRHLKNLIECDLPVHLSQKCVPLVRFKQIAFIGLNLGDVRFQLFQIELRMPVKYPVRRMRIIKVAKPRSTGDEAALQDWSRPAVVFVKAHGKT